MLPKVVRAESSAQAYSFKSLVLACTFMKLLFEGLGVLLILGIGLSLSHNCLSMGCDLYDQ